MKWDKKELRYIATQKEIDNMPIVEITRNELNEKMTQWEYNPTTMNESFGLKIPKGVIGGNTKELYKLKE